MPPRRVLSAVLALASCSGPEGDAGGFTFTLTPQFLDGQQVLAGEPDVELVLIRPGVEPEVSFLGKAVTGQDLSLPKVDPLEAGTVLGLLLEDGGQPDRWDPSATVAYGQLTLDEAPGASATLEVLVPAIGLIGEVGQLAEAKRRYCAAAAMVPGGDVYLFGGRIEPVSVETTELDGISVLAETDSGNTEFVQIDERIPEGVIPPGGAKTRARCAATATPVVVEGAPMILLAGGRRDWAEIDHIEDWHLFDPATETFVRKGKMHVPHSQHLAIPFAGGKVLLFGGLNQSGWPQSPRYDIWDEGGASAGSDEPFVDTGLFHVMGAPFGDDIVVCGGVVDVGGNYNFDWLPQAGCNLVHPNGKLESFEALPVPLAAGAMAPIPGGGLLVTGGYSVNVLDDISPPVFRNTPATNAVWRYRPSDGWSGIADLNHARAHHQMIPLADGRVLVVGGTTEGTGLYGNLVEAVTCPELYDPKTESFIELECTEASGGADPLIALSLDGEGAFVYQGFTRDGPVYDGQARYGLVSTGPPLEP